MATNRPIGAWRLNVHPAPQQWSLSFGHFISHWYQGGFVMLLVALSEDMGLSLTQAGLLFSVKTLDQVPAEVGGTAVILLFGSASLFGSLAVLTGGLIADRHGLMPVFYFLAATIILGNLLVLLVPRQQQNQTQ